MLPEDSGPEKIDSVAFARISFELYANDTPLPPTTEADTETVRGVTGFTGDTGSAMEARWDIKGAVELRGVER